MGEVYNVNTTQKKTTQKKNKTWKQIMTYTITSIVNILVACIPPFQTKIPAGRGDKMELLAQQHKTCTSLQTDLN